MKENAESCGQTGDKKLVTSLWPRRFAAAAHCYDESHCGSGRVIGERNDVKEDDLFRSRCGWDCVFRCCESGGIDFLRRAERLS